MERDSAAGQVLREHMFRKTRLPLIKVDGDQIKMNGRSPLQHEQDIEQTITIFTARQTHHHSIAVFNETIVGDGLPHQPAEARLHLLRFFIEFWQS